MNFFCWAVRIKIWFVELDHSQRISFEKILKIFSISFYFIFIIFVYQNQTRIL